MRFWWRALNFYTNASTMKKKKKIYLVIQIPINHQLYLRQSLMDLNMMMEVMKYVRIINQ